MCSVSFRYLCLLCALLAGVCLPRALSQPASALPSWEEKRLQRMKFDEIVSALGAREGHQIADLGAGEGAFSAALARVVGPQGMVYAVDIDEEVLKRLRKRVADSGLRNVEVIHGAEDNPKLPEGSLDGVLLVDTYH
jgi:ubiquinone/menaquinone biosynthesis C-methylase UbiE